MTEGGRELTLGVLPLRYTVPRLGVGTLADHDVGLCGCRVGASVGADGGRKMTLGLVRPHTTPRPFNVWLADRPLDYRN